MNAIILEDDKEFAEQLRSFLQENFKDIEVKFITDNISDITKYCEKTADTCIYFLDIVLGNDDIGLVAAEKIYEANKQNFIIFVTWYEDKIMYETFFKMIGYNVILKKSPKLFEEIKDTLEFLMKNNISDVLLVYDNRLNYICIPIDKITYIETVKGKNKIKVHHINGIFQVNLSLEAILKKLNSNFVRCHNSYIVNIKKIQKINYGTKMIQMIDGEICCYSYLKGKSLLKKFNHKERNLIE